MWVGPAVRRGVRAALFAVGLVLAAGCTPNAIIRRDTALCTVSSAQLRPDQTKVKPSGCENAALEEIAVTAPGPGGKSGSYLLSFVEFDDQGKAWDPRQETLLFDRMAMEATKNQDLTIVTFVHGWKHNAAETDSNVQAFQALLTAIATAELRPDDTQPRKVIGIYTGWRGETVAAPLDNLTFWTRKDAAQRVAEGSIRGLLGKLRGFHDTLDAGLPHDRHGTLMLTIGHSFGGLVVYSALAQYFVDRAASATINARYFRDHTAPPPLQPGEDPRLISPYGDLVVLINPAFEAMRYDPIRELAEEQHAIGPAPLAYAPRQGPVLVEVTSIGKGLLDGDWATGLAFPIGRALNTGLQATRPRDPRTGESERSEILKSVGHYAPFWTHTLDITADRKAAFEHSDPGFDFSQTQECLDLAKFERESRVNGYLRPAWQRQFRSGAILRHDDTAAFDANNPFWVVNADPNVIADHDDISNAVLENFVTQLFMDSYLAKDPKCRAVIDAP